MIAIIDYGVGNLFSLKSSFAALGESAVVSSDPGEILAADKVILPGVGAFSDAAAKLRRTGLDRTVVELASDGRPIMGICLGMQLLFEESFEYGCHRGLGLVPGAVRPISDVIPPDFKIPHIGWNLLDFRKNSPIFRNIKNGDHVYFVHSYYAAECDEYVTATSDYGAPLTASVQRDNVFGCQFHPEKSGDVGLAILKAFCEMGAGE